MKSCPERTRSQCPLFGDNGVPCVHVLFKGNKEAQTTEPTQVQGRKPQGLHDSYSQELSWNRWIYKATPSMAEGLTSAPRSAILTHSLLYDL